MLKKLLKIVLVTVIGFSIVGCEYKPNSNIVEAKTFKFKITELDPPKHFRAYGVPIEPELVKDYVSEDDKLNIAKHIPFLLYISKHCSNWKKNNVDDIVDITIVKYDDGNTLIERDYDLFCGSGE